jgi:hypothetical protein
LRFRETGLCNGIPPSSQVRPKLETISSGDWAGEEFSLVKAAFPLLAPMHGHRNDEVELGVERNCSEEKSTQGSGQALNLTVLEQVNQLP